MKLSCILSIIEVIRINHLEDEESHALNTNFSSFGFGFFNRSKIYSKKKNVFCSFKKFNVRTSTYF